MTTGPGTLGMFAPAGIRALMWPVVPALVPAVVAQCWFFGADILGNLAVAVVAALVLETSTLKLRGLDWRGGAADGSVIVTALLLALAVPAGMPHWQLVLGVAFAVVVAKHCYGGVGRNLFNPAMAGYAFILVSFPASVTGWPLAGIVDATTAATPLSAAHSEGSAYELGLPAAQQHAWMVINAMYLLGGVLLLVTRACTLDLPVAVVIGLCLTSALIYASGADDWTPVHHLTVGASLCAAFFIATDPVTAPNLPAARLVYGVLIGGLIVAIRAFGAFPDGVAFAVLLANASGPALDELERRLRAPGQS